MRRRSVSNFIQSLFVAIIGVLLLPNAASCQTIQDESSDSAIVSQFRLSKKHRDFACGPTSIYNWLSHGNEELQNALTELTDDKTPLKTVEHIIDTYGSRPSLFNRSRSRYATSEGYGGIGPINQLAIAQEILLEHSESPTELRGEFLQRADNESAEDHLARVAGLFSTSIESGVPVLLHVRCYRLDPDKGQKRQVYGHHVVITSVEIDGEKARITCLEPSGGKVKQGFLQITEEPFTAPTYTWQYNNGKATQDSKTETGRPLLEFGMPGYDKASRGKKIVVANFATFAAENK